jgi:FixJ family two-component response regulator
MTNFSSRREVSVPEAQPIIAIVDDDVSMLRALRRLLTSVGYVVVTYTSAEEFLQSDVLARVGCLVLDIMMPGMSGLELADRLAASGMTLPVIVTTASADEQIRRHAEQAGVVAYLRKPFEEGALLDAVRQALHSDSAY